MSLMNTDLLVTRLLEKRNVLTHLRQLAADQSQGCGDGEINQLLRLLAKKQKLAAILQTVDAQLDPFREEDPETRIWRTPADRQAAQDIARDCDRLLDEVKRMEQESVGIPVVRQHVASRAAQYIDGPSRARVAYLDSAACQAGKLDLSSDV